MPIAEDAIRTLLAATHAKYGGTETIRAIALCNWGMPMTVVGNLDAEVGEGSSGRVDLADLLRRLLTSTAPIYFPDPNPGLVALSIRPGMALMAVLSSRSAVGVASVALVRVAAEIARLDAAGSPP